jgi:hypothetical protein
MGHRGAAHVLRLVAVSCGALAAAACRHDPAAPERLVDGSPATRPPVALAAIGKDTPIASKVEVVAVGDVAVGSMAESCLDRLGAGERPGAIVTRIGVDGASVTFQGASRRGVHACDGTDGREPAHLWCGSAYGRIAATRLTDPRLDLACTTASGAAVAFAWIEPAARTRFVAVRQHGFVEVYEAAAGLPVRVTTTEGIDLEESSAAFEISEHDARGSRLRSYTLTARVAG